MAIDTQNKRRSVHGYTHTPIYPVADGTVGTQDRPHVAWLYAGITISAGFVGEAILGDLLVNLSPTLDLRVNDDPTKDLDVNLSPTVDLEIA